MANEINASISLGVNKNGLVLNGGGSKTADMAGDQGLTNVQIIGTSAEAIVLGDVSTIGYVAFKNLDPTNFVQLALDSGVSTQIFAKLLAGDVTLIKAATATMYAKADTANVNLLVTAVEL